MIRLLSDAGELLATYPDFLTARREARRYAREGTAAILCDLTQPRRYAPERVEAQIKYQTVAVCGHWNDPRALRCRACYDAGKGREKQLASLNEYNARGGRHATTDNSTD